MDDDDRPRARFTRMQDSSAEDWSLILPEAMKMARSLPDRVLAHLELLDGDTTLTDERIDAAVSAIVAATAQQLGARLRG